MDTEKILLAVAALITALGTWIARGASDRWLTHKNNDGLLRDILSEMRGLRTDLRDGARDHKDIMEAVGKIRTAEGAASDTQKVMGALQEATHHQHPASGH